MEKKERSLDRCVNCDNHIAEFQTQNDILNILYGCSKRELRVLLSRIVEEKNLYEVGRQHSVTGERIRAIERKALEKIYRRGRMKGINVGIQELKLAILSNLSSIPFLMQQMVYVVDEDKIDKLADFSYVSEAKIRQEYLDSMNKDITERSIDHLELSVRAHNCLKNAGINKINQLVTMTIEELLCIKNMGRKACNEVKFSLESLGLSLTPSSVEG